MFRIGLRWLFFLKILFIYFEREEKRGRNRGRETSMCERSIDPLPLTCTPIGDWTCNPPCALTRDRTCDLSLCGTMPNPLSHTGQGKMTFKLRLKWQEEARQEHIHEKNILEGNKYKFPQARTSLACSSDRKKGSRTRNQWEREGITPAEVGKADS